MAGSSLRCPVQESHHIVSCFACFPDRKRIFLLVELVFQHPGDEGIFCCSGLWMSFVLQVFICAASESGWRGACGCSWLVLFLLAVLVDGGGCLPSYKGPLWDRRQLLFAWSSKASVEVNETIQARNGHLISPSSLGWEEVPGACIFVGVWLKWNGLPCLYAHGVLF